MIPHKSYTSMDIMALDINSEYLGVSRSKLMENAGASVARYIRERFPGINRILIIAGLGNNGGDGFVAARHLSRYYEVYVDLIGEHSRIRTEEARSNFSILKNMSYSILITEKATVNDIKRHIKKCDLIVDAILGTGVKGELREPIKSIVSIINSSGKPVISIDTPTGLDPTSGKICGLAVRADVTITFHGNKMGFTGNNEYTGEIVISDIGIPSEAEILVGPGDFEVIKRLDVIKPKVKIGIVNYKQLRVKDEIMKFLSERGISFTITNLNSDNWVDAALILNEHVKEIKIRNIAEMSSLQVIKCASLKHFEERVDKIGPSIYLVKTEKAKIVNFYKNIDIYMKLSERNDFKPLILYSPYTDKILVVSKRWVKMGILKNNKINEWILASATLHIALNDELYSYTGTLWLYGGGKIDI